MASVFLAVQESVQREVAIKVLAPTLMGDASFGERFLREARIAAKLRHPHVVQVHDVGVSGGCHYIAMEYLPGGPVLRREAPPRGLRFALRVTREIASALGYAHARGVIHRDIKPDNILLREDGAAVLTDFGIARASDNVRMTMTGSIMGTPSYMSPEQARGVELDGRSDLYSLGVVFHELLTGRVPFSGSDSLSVGIMHITEPVPLLPAEFEWLQPVLERLLAKDPVARFQSGDELAQALGQIEQGLTPTPLRSSVPTLSPPPHASAAAVSSGAGDVHEPTMGRVDPALIEQHGQRRRSSTGQRRARSPWVLGGALLLSAALAATVWWFREPLREYWPASQSQNLLEQAATALAAGRLQRADGQLGARELYEAVLAVDPENAAARQGLQQIGERWLSTAQSLIAEGQAAAAEQALAQARELGVAAAQVDAIAGLLRRASSQEQVLERWLAQADEARRQGLMFDGDNSALALYRRVLELDPGNPIAQNALAQLLSAMSEDVRGQLQAGDLDAAQQQIERIGSITPGHPDLPALQAELLDARRAGLQSLENALLRAEQLQKRGRLTQPAGDNALEVYRDILQRDPGHERARKGLQGLASQLIGQFNRALDDFDFDAAQRALAQAEQVGLSNATAAEARERLSSAQRRHTTMRAQLDAAADPARLRQLLDQAEAALRAGQLMSPPGDSAYDKFRQVQSADPNNAEARAGMARIPLEARRRYDEAMATGKLGTARGYLDALDALPSPDPAVPALKRALAQAYIGFALERLEQNELPRARAAFNSARELDPDNPELVALQARIEQRGG